MEKPFLEKFSRLGHTTSKYYSCVANWNVRTVYT